MSKLITTCIALLTLVLNIKSQNISSYVFSSTTSSYTPIAGTTCTLVGDDKIQQVPIGFSFTYAGNVYTDVIMSTNGFIRMGINTNFTGAAGKTNDMGSATTSNTCIIAAIWGNDSLLANSASYATTGTAPNRVFTAQYSNVYQMSGFYYSNCQIQLYETSNKIKIVYGGNNNSGNSYTFSKGLVGNTYNDYYSMYFGQAYYAQQYNYGYYSEIPAGTTYIFTPPTPCSGTPVTPVLSANTLTVCTGYSLTLSVPTNTDNLTGLSYQWQSSPSGLNTFNTIGTTTNTAFTTSASANTDYQVIKTCTISGQSATSNTLAITIKALPTLSITSSIANVTVCPGSYLFTPTLTGATTSQYNWMRNGALYNYAYGTGSITINNYNVGQETFQVYLTPTGVCNLSTIYSNIITTTVIPAVLSVLSISPNTNTTICAGQELTYSVTLTNGGSGANYQWNVSGVNKGTNSPVFTYSTFVNNNYVNCTATLTNPPTCPSTTVVTSSYPYVYVNTIQTPSVTVVVSPSNTICAGSNPNFQATAYNGGSTPSYQWYLNNTAVGTNSYFYSNNSLQNGDVVKCVMTSNYQCVTTPTATSNSFTMVVKPLTTPTLVLTPSLNTVCQGSPLTYSFSEVSGMTGNIYVYQNTVYSGYLTFPTSMAMNTNGVGTQSVYINYIPNAAACSNSTNVTSSISNYTITASGNPSVTIVSTLPYGSNYCSGTTVSFTANAINGGSSPIYNWFINGVNQNVNSPYFSNVTFTNSPTIYCTLSTASLNACAVTTISSASNSFYYYYNQSYTTPTITISSANSNSACPTSNKTFNAATSFGGTIQWKKNGVNVSGSGVTYVASGLQNGDLISCEITSNQPCYTVTNVATSNTMSIVLTNTYTPTATLTASSNSACAGYVKTFTVQGTNLGSTPSFNWYLNNSYYTATSNPTINIVPSAGTNSIYCLVYPSSDACSGVPNVNTNVFTFTTATAVTPSIAVTPTITTICSGVMATFTANLTNGGTSPAYQWQVNNVNVVGANASTFSTNTLTGFPSIRVYATIDLNTMCVNNTTPYSNYLYLTVNSTTAAPTITISTVGSNTYCAGSSKTFNANITNGGTTPTYQWKKNGVNVSTAVSYNATGLVTGDVITCDLTTNNVCATATLGTSNSITVTVNATSSPSISISNIQGSGFVVCQNAPLTFTAQGVNTGATPSYAWYVNSSLQTTTSTNTVSISTSVAGGKTIYCLITPSADACASPANATSNVLTYTVTANNNPSVVITSTLTSYSNYCAGTTLSFTATPTNGGSNPSYQWQNNGVNVGTNSPYFSSNTFTTNPLITCIINTGTLNACATTNSATSSNSYYYYYNQSYTTPTITINSTTSNSVCAGTSKLFSATTTFAGSYQWKKNGTNVGTGSTYNASGLVTGDLISCQLTSTYPCFTTTNVATSNTLSIIITPSVTPYVTIASPSLTVCQPNSVIYTVSNVAGGTFPSYSWYLNGNLYTTTSATTVSIPWATLGNNHVYTKMTVASDACALTNTATSNVITYTALANGNPTIAIVTPTTIICLGSPINFTANIGNGGIAPTYNWYVNYLLEPTSTTSVLAIPSLTNNATLYCTINTNGLNACATTTTSSSNFISVSVVTPSAVPTISITTTNSITCLGVNKSFNSTIANGGTSPQYQWKRNGVVVGNASTYNSSTLVNGDVITCDLITSLNACGSASTVTSNSIVINALSNTTPSITITASVPSGTVCNSSVVVYSLSTVNAGTVQFYSWYVNGSNVANSVPTLTRTLTSSVTSVYCYVQLGADICYTTSALSSNTISHTVTPNANPTATLTQVTMGPYNNGSVCEGTSITYTCGSSNSGTNPMYQWFFNGISTGVTGQAYTSTVIAAFGSNVSCLVTTTLTGGCITTQTVSATKNIPTGYYPNSITSGITSNATGTICPSVPIVFNEVSYTGYVPQYQWYLNGNPIGLNQNSYTPSNLVNGDQVFCVKSVTSPGCVMTNTIATSNTIIATQAYLTQTTPSMTITPSIASGTVCNGTAVSFSVASTNSGSFPYYYWYKNNTYIGQGSTITTSLTTALTAIRCDLTTGSGICTTTTNLSTTLNYTVMPTITPSVIITPSLTTVCAGNTATFNASYSNGGTSPTFDWYLNGVNTGNTGATYITSVLTANSQVKCVITATNSQCAGLPTATAVANVNVMPSNTTPSITIVSSVNSSTSCSGYSSTFYANTQNQGLTPNYQWQVNGTNVGSNAAIYTSSVLANGDVLSCILSNVNTTCGSISSTANSNSISISTGVSTTPSVTLAYSIPSTTLCSTNAVVSFTANATNVGTNPQYNWYVNGSYVAFSNTTNSYNASIPVGNSNVYCTVTGINVGCTTSTIATSPVVTYTTINSITPSVTVTPAYQNICAGTSITYTANITNGGTSPYYSWFIDNTAVGGNSNTFTSTFTTNATVKCILTNTTSVCVSTQTAQAFGGVYVTPSGVTPLISMVSNYGTGTITACPGVNVQFSKYTNYEGTAPIYAWYVNNVLVASNVNTYNSTSLQNGDVVYCVMTSNYPCSPTASVVSSNSITINTAGAPNPSLTIASSVPSGTLCSNAYVTFTATSVNTGTNPTYNWYVNGVSFYNSTSNVFNSSLYPTQNSTVSCIVTAGSSACSSTNAAMSSNVFTYSPIPYTSVSATVTPSSYTNCVGSTFTFTANISGGATNPTFAWYENNVLTAGTNSVYSTSPSASVTAIKCVVTNTVGACLANTTATSIVNVFTYPNVTPSVTLTATNSGSVCAGNNINFVMNTSNAGGSPNYQWYVNGTPAGPNNFIYSSNTLQNGDVVYGILTSNAACVLTNTAVTTTMTAVVTPTTAPVLSVVASVASGSYCATVPLSFTASVTGLGSSPAYKWYENGTLKAINTPTYTSVLTNTSNVSVYCTLDLTGIPCITTTSATSTTYTYAPVITVIPTAQITPTLTSICAGGSATVNANYLNAGANPTYAWYLDNVNTGVTSANYVSAALTNNALIVCVMTTTLNTCSGIQTYTANASSNVYVVPANSTAMVSITSNTSVCSGNTAYFTSTTQNVTPMATYQWFVNGIATGTNSTSFSSNSLQNGDVVHCEVLANSACTSNSLAISNHFTITVNATMPSSVTVLTSVPAGTVCEQSTITFTAIGTNVGSNATYNWYVDNTLVTSNGNTLSVTPTGTSTSVYCEAIIGNDACSTNTSVTSSTLNYNVILGTTPSLTVTATNNSICYGNNASLSASAINVGTTPTYEWFENNVSMGMNTNTYTTSALTASVVVKCVVTSSDFNCLGIQTDTTWTTINVSPAGITTSVNITSTTNTICPNTQIDFTAHPFNGGSLPMYQWYVNGLAVGTNSINYSSSSLQNGDVISCELMSNASCVSFNIATSNSITVNVQLTNVTPSITISSSTNTGSLCSTGNIVFTASPMYGGGNPTYTWYKNGNVEAGTSFVNTINMAVGDIVTCVLNSNYACGVTTNTALSNGITASEIPQIIASSTTICPGQTVTLTITYASTHTWSEGTTTSSVIVVSPTVTTTYSVSGISTTSQSYADAETITVLVSQTPELCLVSVDTSGKYNELFWEKSNYTNIDSIYIYRETTLNVYTKIGAVDNLAFSRFLDSAQTIGTINGDPDLSSNKYKLRALDVCGNLAPFSNYHQTVFLQDLATGTFTWNNYVMENSSFVPTSYDLYRAPISVGTPTLLYSGLANSFVDNDYNLWMNSANYYIEAAGFNCNPTMKTTTLQKSLSNYTKPPITTSLESAMMNTQISLYPNPHRDVLNIDVSRVLDNMKIELYDAVGRLVYSETITSAKQTISTINFASGMYYYKVSVGKVMLKTAKLIKE